MHENEATPHEAENEAEATNYEVENEVEAVKFGLEANPASRTTSPVCVKIAGSSDVGFGDDRHSCRSLQRYEVTSLQRNALLTHCV